MKEIKQKPAGGKPKTADAARVPKAVVKAAWLQAREAARAGEKQVVGGKDGAYSGAADTGEKGADKLVSTGERVTELAYRGGRKLAERSAGQRRERAKAAQTGGEARKSSGGRKPSCKFPDLKTRPDECKSSSGLFCCSSSGQKRGKTMIVVECLYTSNEIEEETILREQQKRCLAAAASYGWAVRREVFEPLQLSARGMDDRTGIQTILDDVCNRRFDLLMIASMDRLSYDKEEVKAFLAEMDLNGISIFNVGSNTVTLASGWDLMAFIRQMISPENGGDAQ